ncbi:hypothetical protein STEG23_016622, partial [Scotinomys teguina]
ENDKAAANGGILTCRPGLADVNLGMVQLGSGAIVSTAARHRFPYSKRVGHEGERLGTPLRFRCSVASCLELCQQDFAVMDRTLKLPVCFVTATK